MLFRSALIRLYTYKGEAVLDPFLGSGTTSAVAKKLCRSSIGYEINEAYLELIKKKTGYAQDPHSFEIVFRKNRGENCEC